jgi:hypothetical protein
MASIATATSTRIDSGCKHIIATKVNTDYMLKTVRYDHEELLRNKMKYCAHKDDMLLCINKTFRPKTDMKKHAYPAVVSNLGGIETDEKTAIAQLYHNVDSSFQLNEWINHTESGQKSSSLLKDIPDFRFMGYSLGLAYAHASSGDTVVSSLIGGMMTVRNGHFPIYTGDLVQFYFEFENGYFDEHGERLPRTAGAQLHPVSEDTEKRQKFYARGQGTIDDKPGKQSVAYVKSFIYPSNRDVCTFLDKHRIFGKAVSNARPWDAVDIMISRQSH